ncbi:MAG: ParB/RepB/Spo0J family partition protein [Clostridiales bacterium]|nr:ParB/RepB/Spo0J family partition protein [Clostridiales bacterium]
MAAEKRLGRGLSALLGDAAVGGDTVKNENYVNIPIDSLEANPYQPRKTFDEEMLRELSASIGIHGVVQPLVVSRKGNGRYTLIAGERRWRASRMAGLREVPAVIRDLSERELMEVSLIENLQREDLSAIEEAVAMKKIMEEFSMTQEQLARRIGKSRPAVANALRLLALPEEVIEMMNAGKLSAGHGRAVLSVKEELMIPFAREIMDRSLSVREAERLAPIFTLEKPQPKEKVKDVHIRNAEEELTRTLGTRVQINGGEKRGKIVIEYYNEEDLERLYELLSR